VEGAPQGKLQQMQAYGAELVRIRGFGANPDITRHVFEWLQSRAAANEAALQISAYKYSPAGMTGVQTISYELTEQLGRVPDHVFCPAGGGGLALAVARGFAALQTVGKIERVAKVECVQPRGNNTISGPLRDGALQARAVSCLTAISGLQVASVVDGDEAIIACRQSGGTGHVVDDDEVFRMQRRLAREEGIFCEPAAAIAVSSAINACKQGELDPDATVVCIVSATGFKDSPSLARMAGEMCPVIEVGDLNW
jgi:threonine synthase